ncbi:MAG: AgmX/PglI C-terminal domain-containing protein [Myxococcota bacterium]|nr:AgmX/PglI C-terminal domain-containing protein [Myxococcota bacterium]
MDSSNTPIKFELYAGDELVRTELQTGPLIKIGRFQSNHLCLDHDSVSQMHASVEIANPDNVIISDLGSVNGTLVNGERIKRQRLHTGDVVTFGAVRAVVTIVGQRATPSAPAPTVAPHFDDEVSPDGRRVLEVLTLWGGTVIDAQHLQEEESYLIGESDESDYCMDMSEINSRLPDPFPLAHYNGEQMCVNIPAGVTGEVMLNQKVFDLQALINAGKLTQSRSLPGALTLILPFKARCRLHIGELTFLINAVPAILAPPKQSPIQLERQLAYTNGSIVLLFFCFWILIQLIPESPESLRLDQLNAVDKFVEMIVDAEEEKREEEKEQGDKGAQRAKGEEGSTGRQDVPEQDRRLQVKGEETGNPETIRARNEAIASAFVSEIFAGVDSGLLAGDESAIALGALEAFNGNRSSADVGDAYGMGGLGGTGVGRGGGGDGESSWGLGGLSTTGGGSGRGSGKYGRGSARIGTRKARRPRLIPRPPEVLQGSLDKSIIRRVIMSRSSAYQDCYGRQLQSNRGLQGEIRFKIMISGQGKVISARVASTTMNNRLVERCVSTHNTALGFPAPKHGGIVKVRYPFRFKPG